MPWVDGSSKGIGGGWGGLAHMADKKVKCFCNFVGV